MFIHIICLIFQGAPGDSRACGEGLRDQGAGRPRGRPEEGDRQGEGHPRRVHDLPDLPLLTLARALEAAAGGEKEQR